MPLSGPGSAPCTSGGLGKVDTGDYLKESSTGLGMLYTTDYKSAHWLGITKMHSLVSERWWEEYRYRILDMGVSWPGPVLDNLRGETPEKQHLIIDPG